MKRSEDIFNNLLRFSDSLKIKNIDGTQKIWDPIRKKYLIKQEEEFVRQLVLQYFLQDKKWSPKLIKVEKEILVGSSKRRFDIVLYKDATQAKILIECKSPKHGINQQTFDQITDYNLTLKIPFLIVTNGIESHLLKVNFEKRNYQHIKIIPEQNHE